MTLALASEPVTTQRKQQLAQRVEWIDGPLDIPKLSYAAAVMILEHVMASPLPAIERPVDVLRLTEAAKNMTLLARLLTGESTSNVMHANIDTDQLALRIAALRADDAPVSSATDPKPEP